MDRRRFFQLLGAAVLTPVVTPFALASSPFPLILGDGEHDDAPGLNALLRGEVVEFGPLVDERGAGWRGRYFYFPRGTFRITQSLRFPDAPGLDGPVYTFEGPTFLVDFHSGASGQAALVINAPNATVGGHLNARPFADWRKPLALGTKIRIG